MRLIVELNPSLTINALRRAITGIPGQPAPDRVDCLSVGILSDSVNRDPVSPSESGAASALNEIAPTLNPVEQSEWQDLGAQMTCQQAAPLATPPLRASAKMLPQFPCSTTSTDVIKHTAATPPSA